MVSYALQLSLYNCPKKISEEILSCSKTTAYCDFIDKFIDKGSWLVIVEGISSAFGSVT